MSIAFIILTVEVVLIMGFIIGITFIKEKHGDDTSTFAIYGIGLIYTVADAARLYAS